MCRCFPLIQLEASTNPVREKSQTTLGNPCGRRASDDTRTQSRLHFDYALLYFALLCLAVLCFAILCLPLLSSAVLGFAVTCNALLYFAMLFYALAYFAL